MEIKNEIPITGIGLTLSSIGLRLIGEGICISFSHRVEISFSRLKIREPTYKVNASIAIIPVATSAIMICERIIDTPLIRINKIKGKARKPESWSALLIDDAHAETIVANEHISNASDGVRIMINKTCSNCIVN